MRKEPHMEHENLFSKLDKIIKEIQRLDEENPTGEDEEADPRIEALLAEGEAIQKELDPLMRETFRGRPATLAEWDSIMHMCDDLEEESTVRSDE
jgi:hypothetical protein